MYRESFWSGGAVAAFAVFLLAWVIPEYGGRGATYGMPPQLLPSIAAWIMLVCSSVVFMRGAIGLYRSGESAIGSPPWDKIWGGLWPFLYVLAAIYALTYAKVTYAGPFIIGIMLFLLGERRWYILLPCSLGPAIFLYMLSVYLMRIGVV
jgi:hypothetical protein